MKKIFLFILFSAILVQGFSQQPNFQDKKNIYLLDVTLSMFGYNGGPDIFDDVRDELISSINSIQNPSTEIVLVTFQDQILHTWSAYAGKNGKAEIIRQLEDIVKKDLGVTSTNIYDAWLQGKELVDPQKLNVIYLLTDGVHNTSNPTKQNLYDEVERWDEFAGNKDYYAFLVELIDAAKDEQLREKIRQTPKTQVISGIDFFVLSMKDNQPILNLYDDLSFNLDFIGDQIDDTPKDFHFSLQFTDENFELKQSNYKLSEKPFQIEIKPKKAISAIHDIPKEEWLVPVKIDFDRTQYPNIKLLNNQFNLKVKNEKEMVLKMKFLDKD